MKYIFPILIFLSGCANLHKGEIINVQSRVLGIDMSVPVPFAQGVSLISLKLGYIDSGYKHSRDVKTDRSVEQNLYHIGTVHREEIDE